MVLLRLIEQDEDADEEFLVEIVPHREIFENLLKAQKNKINKRVSQKQHYDLFSTYLVICHQAPREDADFLVEGNLVDARG